VARPPQFERREDAEPDFIAARAMAKRLSSADRAKLLAWLCLYYDDKGERWGTLKRRRIAIDGHESWLVKIPHRQTRSR
jgi:hypothetical protein